MGGDEGSCTEGHEEDGSHEAPCHEGGSTKGHEEDGSNEAPGHEGCSGQEGYEEKGSDEAPRHEGGSTKGHEVGSKTRSDEGSRVNEGHEGQVMSGCTCH